MINRRDGIKFFILAFFCFFSTVIQASSGVIQYDINYLENSEIPCFTVKLKSQIDEAGEFIVRFPMGSKNVKLSAWGLTIEPTKDSSVYHLKGIPGKDFEINYQFCLNNSHKLIDWPLIEEHFFYLGQKWY